MHSIRLFAVYLLSDIFCRISCIMSLRGILTWCISSLTNSRLCTMCVFRPYSCFLWGFNSLYYECGHNTSSIVNLWLETVSPNIHSFIGFDYLNTSLFLHLQVCLLECEGHVSSSLTWEVCKHAIKVSHLPTIPEGGPLFKRTGEALEMTSLDLNSDSELLQAAATENFQQGDQDETSFERRSVQYDSSLLESSEDGEGLQGLALSLADEERKPREERNMESDSQLEKDEDDSSEAVTLSKRFGGFQRGRHGYRKLIGSPMRPLQKRYGGFIGVRKSARKWNSQKRVNQLLRQYLGMRSSRSGRFSSVPVTRVWRQNQLWCLSAALPPVTPSYLNQVMFSAAHSSLNCDVTIVMRRTDPPPLLSLCLWVTRNVLTVMSFLLSIFSWHSVK